MSMGRADILPPKSFSIKTHGDEEAYRAEAASCLPTPEQEAIAAKIVERCAEYDRGVRCAPGKF